jgi:hypothetical protein
MRNFFRHSARPSARKSGSPVGFGGIGGGDGGGAATSLFLDFRRKNIRNSSTNRVAGPGSHTIMVASALSFLPARNEI